MPGLRKLTVEEVKVIENKGVSQRRQVEQEYDDIIRQFATGEYAEVILNDGETKPAVRQRMNKAAMRAGVELKWLRGQSDTLKFKVESSPFETVDEDAGQQEAEEALEDEMLAAFELPETEPEPVPAAPKKPTRKQPKAVTGRQAFVEAP